MPRVAGLSHGVGVTGRLCCCSGPQQEEQERCEPDESPIINALRQTRLLLPLLRLCPVAVQMERWMRVCVVCESRALLR